LGNREIQVDGYLRDCPTVHIRSVTRLPIPNDRHCLVDS